MVIFAQHTVAFKLLLYLHLKREKIVRFTVEGSNTGVCDKKKNRFQFHSMTGRNEKQLCPATEWNQHPSA